MILRKVKVEWLPRIVLKFLKSSWLIHFVHQRALCQHITRVSDGLETRSGGNPQSINCLIVISLLKIN